MLHTCAHTPTSGPCCACRMQYAAAQGSDVTPPVVPCTQGHVAPASTFYLTLTYLVNLPQHMATSNRTIARTMNGNVTACATYASMLPIRRVDMQLQLTGQPLCTKPGEHVGCRLLAMQHHQTQNKHCTTTNQQALPVACTAVRGKLMFLSTTTAVGYHLSACSSVLTCIVWPNTVSLPMNTAFMHLFELPREILHAQAQPFSMPWKGFSVVCSLPPNPDTTAPCVRLTLRLTTSSQPD